MGLFQEGPGTFWCSRVNWGKRKSEAVWSAKSEIWKEKGIWKEIKGSHGRFTCLDVTRKKIWEYWGYLILLGHMIENGSMFSNHQGLRSYSSVKGVMTRSV